MKKLIYFYCLAIFIFSCDDSGDAPRNEFHQPIFNQKVLDDYFVTTIAFDNDDNAWIGTFKQGIVKYNAGKETLYHSKDGIPEQFVAYDIAVDSKNNVWIGGDKGLLNYDGSRFTLYNSQNTPMPQDFVQSVAIDSKDNVWFTSSVFKQGGIVKYDSKNWTVYTPENSQLPVHMVQGIAIDKVDNVWLALSEIVNNTYLVKISGNEWKTYSNGDLGFSPYYLGGIQCNHLNQICGVIDYSLSSTIINNGPKAFIFDGKTTQQLPFEDMTFGFQSITIDISGNMWCYGYGGYAVWDGTNWHISEAAFFEDGGVFAIEQAPDRKIWIGTGEGIYIGE